MGGRLSLICETCGATYTTWRSWAARRNGHYCSHRCAAEARREIARSICQWCGKEIIARPSDSPKFCSVACVAKAKSRGQRGPSHWRWNPEIERIRHCLHCGREFRIKGSGYKPGRGIYCSRSCYLSERFGREIVA